MGTNFRRRPTSIASRSDTISQWARLPLPPLGTIAESSGLVPGWENREPAEEVLIVGASLDAPNELVRRIAKEKGAAFGWHRMTLAQLAVAIAMPTLAARGLARLSRLGAEAIVARLVHRLKPHGRLGRYHAVAATPGFPRAIARVIAEVRLAILQPDAVGKVAHQP